MSVEPKIEAPKPPVFNVSKSVERASNKGKGNINADLQNTGVNYLNKLDRIEVIRKGLSYDVIDQISTRLEISVLQLLSILGIPQTTYHKKLREHKILNSRESDLILQISDLLDFGVEVFNSENEKFTRWLKKPNKSIGGFEPMSLFDTWTGIQQVKNSLNRIEYGNMA